MVCQAAWTNEPNVIAMERGFMKSAMRPTVVFVVCFLGMFLAVWRTGAVAAANRSEVAVARLDKPENANTWDPKAAAAYLDRRQLWWMEWPRAQRDHETFCVSCHTAVPYALSRSALRTA